VASIVGFPDPVNEISARVVAAGVVVLGLATIVLDQPWLTAVIAYGFVARVLTGPTLSPLGQLATRVVTPRLGADARFVPGPPKRFAQGIGAVVSVTAAVLALSLDLHAAAYVVLSIVVVAATLEAALGFCVGCHIFALLMRAGVVPERVCEHCRDFGPGGRTRGTDRVPTTVR
jgi:Domain of unknown function (DUF4395)